MTVTKEQHDRAVTKRGRPLTDNPIGTWTYGKRDADAINSRLVSEPDHNRPIITREDTAA